MKVLVSGATGFLGSLLVERLVADGEEVVALTRGTPPPSRSLDPRIKWLAMDLESPTQLLKSLPDIDAVVHLAGATSGAGQDENRFLRENEQTTVMLMRELASQTQHFIYASSQVVYGDARHLEVTEDFPLSPIGSAYACSKVNSENWLRWFQSRYGGQYIILRFCGFLEGGGIVDYMIERAISGQPIDLYSGGKVRRDYLPVRSAVDALVAALNFSTSAGFLPINIGSGQAISAEELARIICSAVNSKSQINLLSESAPQGDFVFAVDRARQLLNFTPGKLKDDIRQYAKMRQMESVGELQNG
jgi:UDP-glucose 4-epimerase